MLFLHNKVPNILFGCFKGIWGVGGVGTRVNSSREYRFFLVLICGFHVISPFVLLFCVFSMLFLGKKRCQIFILGGLRGFGGVCAVGVPWHKALLPPPPPVAARHGTAENRAAHGDSDPPPSLFLPRLTLPGTGP